jgi:TctA family transporter
LDFVAILFGLFGLSEILINAENPSANILETKMSSLVPTREGLKDWAGSIVRGMALGFFLGFIPGLGTGLTSVAQHRVTADSERIASSLQDYKRRSASVQCRAISPNPIGWYS